MIPKLSVNGISSAPFLFLCVRLNRVVCRNYLRPSISDFIWILLPINKKVDTSSSCPPITMMDRKGNDAEESDMLKTSRSRRSLAFFLPLPWSLQNFGKDSLIPSNEAIRLPCDRCLPYAGEHFVLTVKVYTLTCEHKGSQKNHHKSTSCTRSNKNLNRGLK